MTLLRVASPLLAIHKLSKREIRFRGMERSAVGYKVSQSQFVDKARSERVEPESNRTSITGDFDRANRFVASLQVGAAVRRC